MNCAIIIPTYNAKTTIVKLVRELLAVAKDIHIFVVDDSSPDKTADVLRKEFAKEKRLTLLLRKKKDGRGSAVLYGFKKALTDKRFLYFVEMDADLSHDAKDLPKLLAAAKKYDVVINSRYTKGAKIVGWLLHRKIFSLGANLWARLILRIPISDYTNGYRCYTRKVLEALDFSTVHAKGFSVLPEVAYMAYKKGFSFKTLPSTFRFYNLDKSNFSFKEIKESFFNIVRIRLIHH
jgi:dolichol-phosphate mannosyltransferase